MYRIPDALTPYTHAMARPIIVDVIAGDCPVTPDEWAPEFAHVLGSLDADTLCGEIREAHYPLNQTPFAGMRDPRNN